MASPEQQLNATGPLDTLPPIRGAKGTYLTIGVFDGVHRGHQHLIGRLNALASTASLSSCVITFPNHPRTVLTPGSAHSYLSTIDERLALLRETGAGNVLPLPFTKELSQLSYRQFVEELIERLGMCGLLIGPDFAMGRGREGTGPALTALGKELGFAVSVADPLMLDGQVVSTTLVRQTLEAGDVTRAERLLGRPYSLSGTVVSGEARGRLLGFPTANLDTPSDILLPLDGIYATLATVDGKTRPAVTSIGVRPTFGEGRRTVETYIMDFAGDLYGKTMTITLAQRLRDELRFSNVPDLIAQIQADVEAARAALARKAATGGSTT